MPPTFAAATAGARWERNDEGESGGTVWHLSWPGRSDAYLKHAIGPVSQAISDEAARLRWLAGRLPVPAVRLFTQTADEAWLLTDRVPGATGDAWLEQEPTLLPAIVSSCVTLLHRLHALPVDDCPFDASHRIRLADARRNVAAGVVDIDDFDVDHAGWTAAVMLAETEALSPDCPERVVTHGDFSLGNILFDAAGETTGCIDVGRLGVADPYQDFAVLWQNLGEFGDEAQASLWHELGIGAPDQRRLAFHRYLDELF